jgi:plasmid stabilization system protein ParE
MTLVVLRPDAELDVRSAARWYEEQQPGLGATFTDQVRDTVNRIAALPARFPVVAPPLRRALLHQFPYAVYFVAERERAVVVGIFHQHRDPAAWRTRTPGSDEAG